jgi:hypothetical protein
MVQAVTDLFGDRRLGRDAASCRSKKVLSAASRLARVLEGDVTLTQWGGIG